MQFLALIASFVLTVFCALLVMALGPWWSAGAVLFGLLTLIGIYDLVQSKHNITRSYPIMGHLRFLQEAIAPEIHQYFIEGNTEGRPFDRDQRALVYERSKNISGLKPFGTERDVYSNEFEWINHSMAPKPKSTEPFRTTVGGEQCSMPYSCSLFNISSMSFGAISPNAIMAMNAGAKKANFAHWTGEGGLSPYHLKHGGDLVWQVGTGYFGCRDEDGNFDAESFAEQAVESRVKMIELKLSQGAKPGHGGVLPAAKVTPEIAETRRVPMGQDVISPPGHSAFNSPRELCEFVGEIRRLSGGKPTGFKICVGHRSEFLSVCKAMLETGILPDFVTVDGAEGGTGAAPLEFTNAMGTPLRDGLIFVHNSLVGCGLRSKIKIACAGKVTSAAHILRNLAIGADWCNSARGMMMAVGCIQAQACHTNKCPVGVATQDPIRQRALHVGNKSERVAQYHRNTMEALAELVAAIGLEHPDQIRPHEMFKRITPDLAVSYDEAFHFLKEGELLNGCEDPEFKADWNRASVDSF
jgi:glutamate synthase domain-containing protein 2